MTKDRSMRALLAGVLLLTAAPLLCAQEPSKVLTPPEVWSGYDPDAGDFNEEVLKRWTEKGADYKEVLFSAYLHGQTVRVYGLYAAPTGLKSVPAVMHLHGGGQTVNPQWLEAWTARGYACLSCNYHGSWEHRERYTVYPDALKQGNHRLAGGMEMATSPSVRESSWYLWSAIARRALSYLCGQSEVDRDRVGAFGVSMGGTTIWSFALDPRLKAVCAVYGCGWNRYYRLVPKYGPPEQRPDLTADDRSWIAAMEPEAYPPYIKCPVLFLSATNDNHGNMDRAYDTLGRLPPTVEARQAFTPRFTHHIAADFDQDLILWMDTWLKGAPSWPKTPAAKVALGEDGVPVVTVTADRPADVERVDVLYAVENPRAVSRNWRAAAPVGGGGTWRASLPVLDIGEPLFAFSNVRYKSGVQLSSNEEAVVPASLGKARATDSVSALFYDGSDGTGMWTTLSPSTDPVPGRVPVPIRAGRGPGGRPGVTPSPYAALLTYQPGDPKYRAPSDSALSFEVATATGETFSVAFQENTFWTGQKAFAAKVELKGAPGWQTVTMSPTDFKEGSGQALADFGRCDQLKLAGPWKDKEIVFSHFRWLPKPR